MDGDDGCGLSFGQFSTGLREDARELAADLGLHHHLPRTVVDDRDHFVGVGRIVRPAIRHRRGDDVARAVLVLQTLAAERRSARGRADQKAARPLVGSGPDEVADALEAEHRIEDEERQHRLVVHAVRRRRGDPRGERAGLIDAFFEQLAVLRLAKNSIEPASCGS